MGVGGGLDWGKEDADVFVAVRGLDSSLLCGWSTYQSENFRASHYSHIRWELGILSM